MKRVLVNRKITIFALLETLIFLLLPSLAFAQSKQHPVQAMVSVVPPYSLKLSKYSEPGNKQLQLTLSLLDVTEPEVSIKLRLEIIGTKVKITTKANAILQPMRIAGGQTLRLGGDDLQEYFATRNLEFSGVNLQDYLRTGQIPEDDYKLRITVLEYFTNKVISNTAASFLRPRMVSAPVLQHPENQTVFESQLEYPNIVFRWNSQAIGNVSYKFQLWEQVNENIPASTICESLTPVYETETNVKMLNFSTMSCVMKVGTKYLWRITASDPTQSQIFRNDGKSEIFSFRYKNPPQPITGLKGKLIGSNYQFDWDANPAHTSYWGEYYNPQTGNTTEGEISRNQLRLNCDKESYTIKFRVRATCYGDRSRTSEFTDWVELTTPQRPKRDSNFVCGKVFPDREITNLELKTELQEGEILESKNGDTRYEIKTAKREGDGSFKGYMYFIADCWGGAKILCEYWDLKVNTDNIALKISFESEDVPGFVTDPAEIKNYFDELILNANSLATDSRIRDTIPIPQRFDYLYYNDKKTAGGSSRKSRRQH